MLFVSLKVIQFHFLFHYIFLYFLSADNSLGKKSPEANNEVANSVNNLEETNEIISPEANNEQTVTDSVVNNLTATNQICSPEANNEQTVTDCENSLEPTNQIIAPEADNEERVNDSENNMEATNDNDAFDIFSPEIILTEGVDLMSTSTSNQTDNEDDILEHTNLSRQHISTSTPRAIRGPSLNITNSLSSIRRRDNVVSKIILDRQIYGRIKR